MVDEVLEASSEKQQASYRRDFNVSLIAALNNVDRYVKLLPFAYMARVFDPRQHPTLSAEEGMGTNIDVYTCLFRKN